MGYKEWLDRSTIVSDKKLLVFTLSFMAACLVRITDWLSEKTVAIIFLIFFALLLVFLWILIREHESERWKYRGRALLQTRWGTLGTSVLGFGAGVLVYHYRAWFIWLWYEFRKIDKPDEWILVSLFLLGVMMGFFVVRNWSKTQQEFIASLTAALGAAFLAIELHEFADMIEKDAGPDRSAFLSAFFTLVGTHGLHVTFGIIWLVVLMVQVAQKGLITENRRRLMCLSMFWHFLDVVWIGVFTFVYLMGSMR